MSEPLLNVKNLSVDVEDKSILHGINLTINKGETHVLMGPNGAGKSTLGCTLMGNPNYHVTDGEIFFGGENITKELQKAMEVLDMDPSYGFRDLNVGFSGGEKKKAEILQLLLLNPSLAILDETDSGLDVDAVRTVSKGIEEYQKSKDGALLIITHSTRILESLHVDKTHVLVDGRLVAEGEGSLVDEINENGFEQFIASANEKGENNE